MAGARIRRNRLKKSTEAGTERQPRRRSRNVPSHLDIVSAHRESVGSPECNSSSLEVEGMSPVSLANSVCTVKVLALYSSGSQLNAVLNVFRCFPRLEKLYVTLKKHPKMDMENVHLCDPLDPIECLEIHLKKLVFENYKGRDQDGDFAKFFILNAKVLKEIKFSSPKGNDIKWWPINTGCYKWKIELLEMLNLNSEVSLAVWVTPSIFMIYWMIPLTARVVELNGMFFQVKHVHDSSMADLFKSLSHRQC